MSELLKIILPFFYTPKNYNEVLAKLTIFVFWETYIFSFFIRDIEGVGSFLTSIETYGNLGSFLSSFAIYSKMNALGLLFAFFVAIFVHVAKLHDRISDFFRIRERFDIENILKPLAQQVGASLSAEKFKTSPRLRDSLMRKVFYKYASSTASEPLVQKHDIYQALNGWAWFWILLEAIAICLMFATIAFFLSGLTIATIFAMAAAVLCLLSYLQYRRLESLSRPQVETIASDEAAAAAVKQEFDALSD